MNTYKINIKSLYVISLILYIGFSLFMSEYFIQLDSKIKEFIILPFLLAFLFSSAIKKKFNFNIYVYLYLIFLILFCFIGLINHAPDKFGIRYYLIPLVIYLVVRYEFDEPHKKILISFIWIYLWFILFIGLYELIYNTYPLISLIKGDNFFDNLKIIRTYLFFQIPNLAGLTLSSIFLFLYLNEKQSIIKTISLSISLVILSYIFSKTTIFALVISITFYYFLLSSRKQRLIIAIILFLLLFYIADLSLNDESFLMRITMWGDSTLGQISGFGDGIGFVSVSSSSEGGVILDSDILRFLLEIGVFGLLSFLLFLFLDAYKLKNYKAMAYGFFIFLNMSMGDFHSMYPGVSISYICLALLFKNTSLVNKNVSTIAAK